VDRSLGASFFTDVQVGLARVALDGRWLQVNLPLAGMLGYDRDELLALNFHSIFFPDDLSVALRNLNFDLAVPTQSPVISETRLMGKSGLSFWAEVHATRVAANELFPPHVMLIVFDISAKKEHDVGVIENERRLELLLDQLPHKKWILGANGSINWFNKTMRDYTDYPANPIADSNWNLVHPDDQEKIRDLRLASHSAREPYRFDFRLWRASDRQWRWHLAQVAPLRSEHTGEIWAWVGTAIENHELYEKEALMDAVGRSTTDLIYAKDTESRFLYVNEALARLWGKSTQDMLGLSVLDYSEDEDDALAVLAVDRRIIDSGKPVEIEERATVADGSLRYFLSHKAPLRIATGEVVGIVGVSRDVTEARQHDRHRELLIRELNHRVKNTLATVQSLASRTLRPHFDARIWSDFESRLMALSDAHDLLTKENWDTASLEDILIQVLRPRAEDKNDRMILSGCLVRVGPRQALAFSMIFHELMTNAVKYGALSSPFGCVAVSWTRQGSALRLDWREQGGPAVKPPARLGFGSRLIDRVAAHELGGSARTEFGPEGVVCTLVAALEPEPMDPDVPR
jgi:PAS domain S-box-containing protein